MSLHPATAAAACEDAETTATVPHPSPLKTSTLANNARRQFLQSTSMMDIENATSSNSS